MQRWISYSHGHTYNTNGWTASELKHMFSTNGFQRTWIKKRHSKNQQNLNNDILFTRISSECLSNGDWIKHKVFVGRGVHLKYSETEPFVATALSSERTDYSPL